MPYDESLAARVRALVAAHEGYSERKMFGGVCFMLNGNMFAGVVRDDLMLRVGKDAFEDALKRPGAKPMDFTGRPMVGMVFVEPQGCASQDDLRAWLNDAVSFAETIPPKRLKAGKVPTPTPRRRGGGQGVGFTPS